MLPLDISRITVQRADVEIIQILIPALFAHVFENKLTKLMGKGNYSLNIRAKQIMMSVKRYKPVEQNADSIVVNDVAGISAFFGVSRALEIYRTVKITRFDMHSANITEQVKICEIGPFVCLKLQAYAGRVQGKDIFDTDVKAQERVGPAGLEPATRGL